MLANTIFEGAVDRILDVTQRFASALEAAGIPYRVVGGLAVFLHVDPVDPMAARLTKDVDVGIDRRHLDAIGIAVKPYGFTFRHVAGVDMFLDAKNPGASAVRSTLCLWAKKYERTGIFGACAGSSEPARTKGFSDRAGRRPGAHVKLTSFRLKDQVHIQDLDGVGLITPEIEQTLSAPLLARLKEVRAKE